MPRIPTSIAARNIAGPATGRSLPPASTMKRGPNQARELFPSRAMNQMQTAIRSATSPVKALPFADGNLITGVTFTAGVPASIPHGLGRAWTGYLVANMSGAGATFVRAAPNASSDRGTITITASANCTADIWVY